LGHSWCPQLRAASFAKTVFMFSVFIFIFIPYRSSSECAPARCAWRYCKPWPLTWPPVRFPLVRSFLPETGSLLVSQMPPAAITMIETKDTKFRKRSRFEANIARNFEKIQKQAQESVKKYDKPLKDKRAHAAKTNYEKERVWQAWVWYALMSFLLNFC
jgi:hypothetical protein